MFRKIKCRYYPNCIDEEECFFVHQEEINSDLGEEKLRQEKYCPEGENCHNQSCNYGENKHKNLKNILCRFQQRCDKPECIYKHVADRASFLWNCTKNYEAK